MNLLHALALIKEPNYTTPEQAQKLLNLGVPIGSADMYYKHIALKPYIFSDNCLFSIYSKVEDITPCWSVGQLIKIYLICNPYESDDDLMFMLTSGVEVPDLCHYIITWLEYIKPNFDKVNEIIG